MKGIVKYLFSALAPVCHKFRQKMGFLALSRAPLKGIMYSKVGAFRVIRHCRLDSKICFEHRGYKNHGVQHKKCTLDGAHCGPLLVLCIARSNRLNVAILCCTYVVRLIKRPPWAVIACNYEILLQPPQVVVCCTFMQHYVLCNEPWTASFKLEVVTSCAVRRNFDWARCTPLGSFCDLLHCRFDLMVGKMAR